MRPIVTLCVLVLVAAPAPTCAETVFADTVAADAGAQLYAKYCAPCHGAHLEGYASDNAPSLLSQTFRETATDAFLRAAIERGRFGTAMAGYAKAVGGPLGPGDVDALIAYVRGGLPAPTPLPDRPPAGSASNGGLVYAANCESCHGTAEQRSNAVHLANAMFLASASDAYLRYAIVRGRPGTAMQAWGAQLSAQQIEDVVAYLRSLARPVPPAPPLPSAAVAANGRAGAANLATTRKGPSPQVSPAATLPEAPPVEGVVINPKGKPADLKLHDGRYVSVADVAAAYDEKRRLVIVDARTTSDYLQLHIPGAMSIPYFDLRDLATIPPDGTWIVAYCGCPHHLSGIVLDELRKRGYEHSAVLDEGVFVWQQRGHPVVVAPGQPPFPAPPPNGPPYLRDGGGDAAAPGLVPFQ